MSAVAETFFRVWRAKLGTRPPAARDISAYASHGKRSAVNDSHWHQSPAEQRAARMRSLGLRVIRAKSERA